jgi:hypothetical protein
LRCASNGSWGHRSTSQLPGSSSVPPERTCNFVSHDQGNRLAVNQHEPTFRVGRHIPGRARSLIGWMLHGPHTRVAGRAGERPVRVAAGRGAALTLHAAGSHLSVAQGCLRSLWKSGSKKEALELTCPSGGAVVQRLHRPRPAWPERLVDSAARTDAIWVPSPGPVLREGRPGRCGVRRTRRIPRLAASMASWRVSPAR